LLLPVRVRNPVSGFGGALLVYGGVSRGWGRSSHRSGVKFQFYRCIFVFLLVEPWSSFSFCSKVFHSCSPGLGSVFGSRILGLPLPTKILHFSSIFLAVFGTVRSGLMQEAGGDLGLALGFQSWLFTASISLCFGARSKNARLVFPGSRGTVIVFCRLSFSSRRRFACLLAVRLEVTGLVHVLARREEHRQSVIFLAR
jgi:hypothetical protein